MNNLIFSRESYYLFSLFLESYKSVLKLDKIHFLPPFCFGSLRIMFSFLIKSPLFKPQLMHLLIWSPFWIAAFILLGVWDYRFYMAKFITSTKHLFLFHSQCYILYNSIQQILHPKELVSSTQGLDVSFSSTQSIPENMIVTSRRSYLREELECL